MKLGVHKGPQNQATPLTGRLNYALRKSNKSPGVAGKPRDAAFFPMSNDSLTT